MLWPGRRLASVGNPEVIPHDRVAYSWKCPCAQVAGISHFLENGVPVDWKDRRTITGIESESMLLYKTYEFWTEYVPRTQDVVWSASFQNSARKGAAATGTRPPTLNVQAGDRREFPLSPCVPALPLILFSNHFWPVSPLQSAHGEMPVRHFLKVVNEDEIDRAAAGRAD